MFCFSGPAQSASLFDDTSTQQVGFGGQQPGYPSLNPAQLANDPMANMAFQYGTSLASQGRDYVDKNVRVHCISLLELIVYCWFSADYFAAKYISWAAARFISVKP